MSYQTELNQLIHISQVLGCNYHYVQVGGGNTSVKCADGRKMLIKASGTPLYRMSQDEGWVCVDMRGVAKLFENREIIDLPSAERESRVLALLYESVIEPKNARPSVETPLHMLLDKVVMHSHSEAVHALVCHPMGESFIDAIWGADDPHKPLWIPYIDPGATLAFATAEIIKAYKADHDGTIPASLLLKNHGFFCSAPNVAQCVALHESSIRAIERFLVNRRPAGIQEQCQKMIKQSMRDVFEQEFKAGAVLHFSSRGELTEAARGDAAYVFQGALTPDHIVYTGPQAVFVTPESSRAECEQALRAHQETYKTYPRLIVVKGQGVCVAGANQQKIEAAEEVAASAVRVAQFAQGDLTFLNQREADFILNWEAEHYRSKQM